jgi:hypothetical protein
MKGANNIFGLSGRESKRVTDTHCVNILRMSCHVNAFGTGGSRRENRKPRMEKLTAPRGLPGRSHTAMLTGPCAA